MFFFWHQTHLSALYATAVSQIQGLNLQWYICLSVDFPCNQLHWNNIFPEMTTNWFLGSVGPQSKSGIEFILIIRHCSSRLNSGIKAYRPNHESRSRIGEDRKNVGCNNRAEDAQFSEQVFHSWSRKLPTFIATSNSFWSRLQLYF